MKIEILSLFPQLIEGYFSLSLAAKAVSRGIVSVRCIDIRDFASGRHRSCDDAPYGGGAGMILSPDPLGRALESIDAAQLTIYPTPSGRLLCQNTLERLAHEPRLVILCGRYEGIDQRIIDRYVDEEISIGDYVLASGDTAALVILDGLCRLLDGAISPDSLREESFQDGLLEYPHYTRPEVWQGMPTPSVLLSGNHEEIRRWRRKKQIEKTARYRPDLLQMATQLEE